MNCSEFDRPWQVQSNCSPLLSVSVVLSDIHDVLSTIRHSLTQTIDAIYNLTVCSLDHLGVDPYILEKNLEYRLDLSEAFEQLMAGSVSLDTRVLAYRSYLAVLDKDSEPRIIDSMPNHFSQNLIAAQEQLREILLSFMFLLCRTLFLNIALAFSNELLRIGSSGSPFQGSKSIAILSNTIDETNELLDQFGRPFNEPGTVSLANIFSHFLLVGDAASRSAEKKDRSSFDLYFSESERLSLAFIEATSVSFSWLMSKPKSIQEINP